MSQGYLDCRFRLQEKIGNFISYIHKTIPGYCIIVDTAKNLYTDTIETPTYVKNHMSDFEWKPIEAN